jgi:hypothetical protein
MDTTHEQSVQCPYCGEVFTTMVDCSAGDQVYIEDCQVCCRPLEFHLVTAPDGSVASLQVKRDDE